MNTSIQSPELYILYSQSKNVPSEDESLLNEVNECLEIIKNIINSGIPIYPKIQYEILENIFNLRVKANYWILKNNIPLEELLNNISFKDPRLSLLKENINFSIRNLNKISNLLSKRLTSEYEESIKNFKNIPLDYANVINVYLKTSVNNRSITMIRFINSTIYIEFVILSALMIDNGIAHVDGNTINELSEIIVKSTHDYLAYSVELGIINLSPKKVEDVHKLSLEVIKEQHSISEEGFQNWANQL